MDTKDVRFGSSGYTVRYEKCTTRQEICTIREVHDMTVREYAIRVYYWYERFIDIGNNTSYKQLEQITFVQCDTIRLSDKSLLFRYDKIRHDSIVGQITFAPTRYDTLNNLSIY